jgi:hypothetical protein
MCDTRWALKPAWQVFSITVAGHAGFFRRSPAKLFQFSQMGDSMCALPITDRDRDAGIKSAPRNSIRKNAGARVYAPVCGVPTRQTKLAAARGLCGRARDFGNREECVVADAVMIELVSVFSLLTGKNRDYRKFSTLLVWDTAIEPMISGY